MKILNSKYDAKCKACGEFINEGDRVRWSKIDGVSWTTCMACPHEPKAKGATPANGTPELVLASSAALQAALADGQALRTRVGEQEAALAMARECFKAQRDEIARLTEENARLNNALHATSQQSALVEAANHALALDADDDCPL